MRRTLLALLLVCAAALPAYAQTNSDTITADEDAATIPVTGTGSVGIFVTGTFNATLQFEATITDPEDIGSATWISIEALPGTGPGVTSTTATGGWTALTSGYTHVRVRASAYTSGTATVTTLTAAAPGRGATGGAITNILGITSAGQKTMAESVPVVPASDWAGQINPSTSGGLSISRFISAGSTNATNLKASAGQPYWIYYFSLDATPVYLHLYNTAGTPTCNASIIATIPLPSNSTAANGAAAVIEIPYGLAFSNGIGYCVTTAADGTGSVSANEVIITFGYK